jgi:enoyl-CoA hydratase/carnithine racemase/phenylpropionate dioxygenase-like ring-hydroxylating dioxygenase large terminal subunit
VNAAGTAPEAERCVLTADHDRVRVLTLNRPGTRNAIDLELRVVLAEAIEGAMAADGVRVVIVTGVGGTFCSGGDISTMRRPGADGIRPRTQAVQRVIRAIWNGPKPVLAAVEGYAFGAGAALALACDRVVVAADATFSVSFTGVGIAGDMGIFASLPARAGVAVARQLMLLPRRLTGQEAMRLGLADSLAEPGDALASALRDADAIAVGPPLALAGIKAMLARWPAKSFRCPYHGWTYRNTGELIGFPFSQGYGGRGAIEAELSLATVPRIDSHQGFVFASMAADGPSLAEHLGEAAGELDRLARLSPDGEVELTAGWLKHRTRANWKLLAESETDGYHPQFVHGSIFSVTQNPIGALYSDKSTAVTRNLGHGHSENDLRPEFRLMAEPMRWFGTTPARVPDYVRAMHETHGEAAERILIEGAPHVMVFPNLFIAEIQVFVIQPVSAGECVQYSTAVQLKGAPELNRRMVSQSVGSVGPAGMLLADDTEMYERNQRGVAMLKPEWLDLRRGLRRELLDERGLKVGTATDETGMRGFWSHYLSLMAAA